MISAHTNRLPSIFAALDSNIVEEVAYDENHELFLDGGAIFKKPRFFFKMNQKRLYPLHIAGKAVILGFKREPETGHILWCDHSLELESIETKFLGKEE